MSITSLDIEPGYPKTSRRLEGARIVRKTTYRLKVITDDPQETGPALEGAIYSLYPQWAVGFDLGGGFTIRETSLTRSAENRKLHFFDITADDQVTDQEKDDKDKPPDQRRSVWSWDFETEEIAFTKDIDDEPVVTSAGDPIEVTTSVIIPVLTIERQQPSFDPDTILNFCNHTNNAAFWGAPPGSVLCAGIRERKGETFNKVEYRAVSYTFKFRIPEIQGVIEGWKLLLIDHGPNELDSGGDIVAITDANGRKITANLDGTGAQQDPSDPPHVLRFKQFKEADFGQLNLNWPLS